MNVPKKPFFITWDDDEKTILRVDVTGHWSIAEFHTMVGDLMIYMRSVSTPVYVIADALQSAIPPLGILWETRYFYQRAPHNYCGGVVVTANAYLLNIVNTAVAVYESRTGRLLSAAYTLKTARQLIEGWKAESAAK